MEAETAPTSTVAPLADGLVIVDKPAGWTSHDVVGRMRRLTGIRRIGHAGTLDPLATGVLPLGIGQGTRVLEYLSGAEKVYTATLRLGATTDTYDADGTVTSSADWSTVTERDVGEAVSSFLGAIDQRPPAYSAIKQAGVPLYRRARAGESVEPPLRRVQIYAIDLLTCELPELTITVRCSTGTYIRSLAHDLGARLGCGGYLMALRRTAAGGFTIDRALTLEQWQAVLVHRRWPAHILPLDAALLDHPAIVLDAAASARLRDGVPPVTGLEQWTPGILCRAYDESGTFLAALRGTAQPGWRAEKVFGSPSAPPKKAAES